MCAGWGSLPDAGLPNLPPGCPRQGSLLESCLLMRLPLRILLLTLCAAAASGHVGAQPCEGSQLPPDENACAMCHGEADLWEKETLRLHMPAERFADDVHWQKGVNCHDCHGGDPSVFDPGDLHAKEDGFRELADVKKACTNCHQDLSSRYAMSLHGELTQLGYEPAANCADCHGAHDILPVSDPRSRLRG